MSFTTDDYGKVVSFSVRPTGLIPTVFSRVKVLAVLDPDTAIVFIEDPAAVHANVFASLPVGTPNSFRGYNYVKLQLANGEVTCLGLPWIDFSTLVVHENATMTITVNNISNSDVEPIRQLLVRNGYNNINIVMS